MSPTATCTLGMQGVLFLAENSEQRPSTEQDQLSGNAYESVAIQDLLRNTEGREVEGVQESDRTDILTSMSHIHLSPAV